MKPDEPLRLATVVVTCALAASSRHAPKTVSRVVGALAATVGVAHGGIDHRLPQRLGIAVPGGTPAIVSAYASLSLATFAALRDRPRATTVALAVISAFHFATAESAYARASRPDAAARERTLTHAAVGLVAIATAYRPLPGFGIAGLVPTLVALAGALRAARRGDSATALDLAVPVLAMAYAPEPLGFGIYFGSWHAPRHVARLIALDAGEARLRARLGRFAVEAAPATLAALAGALWLALRGELRSGSPAGSAAIVAITVPHQVIVSLLDRRYGPSSAGFPADDRYRDDQ